MKISNTPNYIINQTYSNPANPSASQNQKSQKPSEDGVPGTKTDSINISGRTKDLQKISKAMETEPTDRQKYVADIKSKFENNQYDINAETIAKKMTATLMDEIS